MEGGTTMNILFLTLLDFKSYSEHNIYCDLIREFIKNGNDVYCISPTERKNNVDTHLAEDGKFLKLKVGNIQKTNIVEKGVSTLLLEKAFINAVKNYFRNIDFDLIICTTPPITLAGVVKYMKKEAGTRTYLLLKDIFPQNSIDLGMLKKNGIKGILYKYFRAKEKELYGLSDWIGCMSDANVQYVLENNPEINPKKVEVCPNCIDIQHMILTECERSEIRKKYGIPKAKKVFVYGGNLGKPQGIHFLIECLKTQEQNQEAFFLIVGSGTEYGKLKNYFDVVQPTNMMLLNSLPKEEYEKLVAACDVGMVFLDYRFTIPNFPSRILSYMQAGLPVLVCSDPNTDMGDIVSNNGFGWKCLSNDVEDFDSAISACLKSDCSSMGAKAVSYLKNNYSAELSYKIIENTVAKAYH